MQTFIGVLWYTSRDLIGKWKTVKETKGNVLLVN